MRLWQIKLFQEVFVIQICLKGKRTQMYVRFKKILIAKNSTKSLI